MSEDGKQTEETEELEIAEKDKEREYKKLKSQLDDLKAQIIYRSESGFLSPDALEPNSDEGTGMKQESISGMLQEAYNFLRAGRFSETVSTWLRAFDALHRFERAQAPYRRHIYIYATPLYVYLIALLIALIVCADWIIGIKATVASIPTEMGVYGMIGAILRALWWVHKKTATKSFRPQFYGAYLAGPWIGLILGMMAWALVEGGAQLAVEIPEQGKVVNQAESSDSGEAGRPSLPTGLIILGLMAGFSWEWFMEKLNRLRE